MTRLIERISLGRAFGVDRLRADSTDRPRRGGAGIGGGIQHILHFAQKDAGGSQFGRGRTRRVKISLRQCRFIQTKSRENAANHSLAELSGRAEKRNVFYSCPASGCFSKCGAWGAFPAFRFPPLKSAHSERSFLRLCKPLFFVAKHMKLRYCKNGRIFKDSER